MRDLPGPFLAALADRYVVERELGQGGNAVVYLAHDRKHERKVALKVLLPDLALSVRTERFLHEIQIAAQLTHPHILMLIDSGEAAGCLYYVMPYVEGESLRERLEREQQLPVADALEIARDVADALAYAHQHQVVHRDIKPENILLEAGDAVVADFGIARALTAASGQSVTASGIAVGTPDYMSPEQGAGSRDLDGRSDVYSLGCVVYEMLAGQPPFTGDTPQEILARHALEPVAPLRKRRPEIPRGVEAAILVALAKRPAERFATVAEFAEALAAPETAAVLRARRRRRSTKWVRRVFAGGAVVLLGAVAVGRWRASAPGTSIAPTVAVLPFVNIGGDTTNEYFSDGMTEELINALAQVEGLRVPGRTSSFAYQGKNPPLGEIGAELRVATVLEGSVRKSSAGLRVSARLVNVADGYQIWSEQYDRPLTDVVAVQEDIARAVAGALRVKLGAGGAAPLARRYTENVEAYDLYLRGRHFFWNRRNREAVQKAIDYFSRAIALDSGYALAYSGLADAYVLSEAIRYVPREEAYVKAAAAALTAVTLDSQLAEAYVSLGRVRQFEWDWEGAEEAFRQAILLNPRSAAAHSWYGYFLAVVMSVRGRADEGVRETRLGVELDPLNASINSFHGIALRYARRYDEALEYHRRAAEMNPDLAGTHYNGAWAYLLKGMYQEALAELDTAARLNPNQYGDPAIPLSWRGAPPQRVMIAVVYGRQGRRAEALAILRELEQRTERTPWIARAYIYAALGDRDRTLEALGKMIEQRAMGFGANLGSAQWDLVRSDPRFQQLVEQAGLQ